MATWQLIEDGNNRLVRIVITGTLDKESYYQALQEGMESASSLGYNTLWDLRETRLETPWADIYFSPKKVEAMKEFGARNTKLAGLVKSDDLAEWKTVETFYVNSGFQAAAFTSEEEALHWLKEGDKETR